MRWCRVWGVAGGLLSASMGVACGSVVTVDSGASGSTARGGDGGSTSQGGATGGAAGTTSQGGSTTAPPGCIDPVKDCPGDTGPCNEWACDASVDACVLLPVPDGTPLPPEKQVSADCQSKVCVSGQPVSVPDDNDVPDDANGCTIDSCVNGLPLFTPAPMGSACSAGSVCDGMGNCFGCLTDSDCPLGSFCMAGTHTCVIGEPCMDNIQNGAETDVDCGGPCPPCGDGQSCLVGSDCLSGSCVNSVCQ